MPSRSHSTRSSRAAGGDAAEAGGGEGPGAAAAAGAGAAPGDGGPGSHKHHRRHPSSHHQPSPSSQHRSQHHHRRSSVSSSKGSTSTALARHPQQAPHNDTEASHVASRDRPPPPSPSAAAAARGPDSSRSHRRSGSHSRSDSARHRPSPSNAGSRDQSHRHGHHRGQRSDMSPAAVASSGAAAPHGVPDPHAVEVTASSAAKQSRSRTTIPTQSGKWILGKTIGAGSMGKVKLARKEDGSEQVACKIIPRGSTDDGRMSRAERERADLSKEVRTAREAAIVTLLNHPHICGLRDVVRTNYHWYMLFEYVNGGQMLDYIISHGKLKEKQARKFSRQIASALDYCHRNSIVHRDLKIENILISKTGDIKIIDFGLSNLFAPKSHLKTFCGSLYFAAPELLQARAYTGPEVDIWSFGIVLYVLVCGKVPFDDQSMPALHAKIKKGLVDYPSWLSTECKHLMSRMLVTDPKQRATMQEVLSHPWMTKGFTGPPDNYLPPREPLSGSPDPDVMSAMQGFNFGSPDSIRSQLLKTIDADEYQRAVALYQREREQVPASKDAEKKRGFGFDFYKRRNSGNSRDTLTGPSSEALQLGNDPLNAYSPLLSIYYLVKEKQDRERTDKYPSSASLALREKEKEKDRESQREKERDRDGEREQTSHRERARDDNGLVAPQAAYTNAAAFEMPGEQPTGGRTRPRARTHGEDDAPETARPGHLTPLEPKDQKKEGAATSLLRRFSTRKRRDPERLEKDRSHPPVVQVHTPTDGGPGPRKSFSMRRGRQDGEDGSEPRVRSGSSQPQHGDLLSPPMSAGGSKRRSGGLGRSTSVNSGDMRRKESARLAKEPPQTSGSDQSIVREQPTAAQRAGGHNRSASMRAKSLGHARRESVQRRRLRREAQEGNVPEETDRDLEQDQSGPSTERLGSSELAKPVFLKGLFSVSTTSGKSVPAIRADIRRVLRNLNVDFTEIKGGFSCRHAPSIDLKKVAEAMPSSPAHTPGHRRRFSFGGLMRNDDRDRDESRDLDRPPTTPRTPGRDRSFSNSETSVDSIPRRNGHPSQRTHTAGETSTQVTSDLGGNMVLEFEIFIVKVPLLSLHGIQFKRMEGNTWQFKNMADQILKELRL